MTTYHILADKKNKFVDDAENLNKCLFSQIRFEIYLCFRLGFFLAVVEVCFFFLLLLKWLLNIVVTNTLTQIEFVVFFF